MIHKYCELEKNRCVLESMFGKAEWDQFRSVMTTWNAIRIKDYNSSVKAVNRNYCL